MYTGILPVAQNENGLADGHGPLGGARRGSAWQ